MQFSKAIEGFQLHLTANSYSPVTIKAYIARLHHINLYLEHPGLDEITTQNIVGFLESLRKRGLTEASVHSYWKVVRSFYNWASPDFIPVRPDNIPGPKAVNKAIVPFTKDEVIRLVKACKTRRDTAVVLLFLDTGLRVSEAARLCLNDVDLETGAVIVRPFLSSRKSRPRQVWLGNSARRAVWAYLATRKDYMDKDSPLLATERGGPLERFMIRDILRRISKRAGVIHCYPHKFRHTFAIEYLRNGGDVFTLQRLLGHNSLATVKIYLDISDSDTGAAHRKASPADKWRL